jgi:SAM-dependent methyltransferase
VKNGRVPGASGYRVAKWLAVERALAGASERPYGHDDAGLDERVVEYPWVFDRLATRHASGARILDAGSVLNYPPLLSHVRSAGYGPLSIITLRYEGYADVSDDVRYEFADLRSLPYRDDWFSVVISLSTLEHVGMDNAVYGDLTTSSVDPAVEVQCAMQELRRVTMPGGTALLSVPFGLRSNRGWMRVFDAKDLEVLTQSPGWQLEQARFFRVTTDGWRECSMEHAQTAGYNEHLNRDRPGVQTAPPSVAAAEAVALVELTKR